MTVLKDKHRESVLRSEDQRNPGAARIQELLLQQEHFIPTFVLEFAGRSWAADDDGLVRKAELAEVSRDDRFRPKS